MRSIDLTDVPPVREKDLALAIRAMLETEQVRGLAESLSQMDRKAIEQAFWRQFQGATATGVATLIRFWCLVDAFQSRRLRVLLSRCGHAVFDAAATAAASHRLNLDWGFKPQRLIWAVEAAGLLIASSEPADTQMMDVALAA